MHAVDERNTGQSRGLRLSCIVLAYMDTANERYQAHAHTDVQENLYVTVYVHTYPNEWKYKVVLV
jgi:hypothetical protein